MSIHVDLVAVSPTWSVRQVGPTFHLMTTSGFLLVCHHQLMLCLQQWHYEDALQMANDYVICIAVSILACTINERLENVQEFADLVIFFYVEDFNTIILVCVAVGPVQIWTPTHPLLWRVHVPHILPTVAMPAPPTKKGLEECAGEGVRG